MSNANYVPISDLVQQTEPERRVLWSAELPEYAPADHIGVNMRALNRFARLSGFAGLTVVGYNGETTEYTPGVDGIHTDGTATRSAASSVNKADMSKGVTNQISYELPNGMKSYSYDYYWADGKLALNIPEIVDRLSRDTSKGNLRDSSSWSNTLNSAVKAGVRDVAKQNLQTNVPTWDQICSAGSLAIFTALNEISSTFTGEAPLVGWLSCHAAYVIQNKVRLGLPVTSRRFTFVLPTLQYDRLAAVNALSRTTKFVKAI